MGWIFLFFYFVLVEKLGLLKKQNRNPDCHWYLSFRLSMYIHLYTYTYIYNMYRTDEGWHVHNFDGDFTMILLTPHKIPATFKRKSVAYALFAVKYRQ
jgi:hypothetical protein